MWSHPLTIWTPQASDNADAQSPHPGEFITAVYLEPNGISGRELATALGVAASTLSRSPESWRAMQDDYNKKFLLTPAIPGDIC
jgi:hypothetical protein